MAAKYILLLAFVTAVVGAEINCNCDNDDSKELWEYLTKISQDFDDLTDEDKEAYSVLPGFLSPLYDCNCLSKRRKRSITPSVAPPETLSTDSHEDKKVVTKPRRKMGNKIQYGSRSCPLGHVRIVYWCVPEEKID